MFSKDLTWNSARESNTIFYKDSANNFFRYFINIFYPISNKRRFLSNLTGNSSRVNNENFTRATPYLSQKFYQKNLQKCYQDFPSLNWLRITRNSSRGSSKKFSSSWQVIFSGLALGISPELHQTFVKSSTRKKNLQRFYQTFSSRKSFRVIRNSSRESTKNFQGVHKTFFFRKTTNISVRESTRKSTRKSSFLF